MDADDAPVDEPGPVVAVVAASEDFDAAAERVAAETDVIDAQIAALQKQRREIDVSLVFVEAHQATDRRADAPIQKTTLAQTVEFSSTMSSSPAFTMQETPASMSGSAPRAPRSRDPPLPRVPGVEEANPGEDS